MITAFDSLHSPNQDRGLRPLRSALAASAAALLVLALSVPAEARHSSRFQTSPSNPQDVQGQIEKVSHVQSVDGGSSSRRLLILIRWGANAIFARECG